MQDSTQANAIVTVTGLDHVGIVAAIAVGLAELNTNINNISQTLMDDFFTMILECQFDPRKVTIEKIQEHLNQIGQREALVVKVQSEAIFHAMHEL